MNNLNSFQLSGYLYKATKLEVITFGDGNTSNKFTLIVKFFDMMSKEHRFYVEIIANEVKLKLFQDCLFEDEPITINGELSSAPFTTKDGRETAFLRLRPSIVTFPKLGKQIEIRGAFNPTPNGSVSPKPRTPLSWDENEKPPF